MASDTVFFSCAHAAVIMEVSDLSPSTKGLELRVLGEGGGFPFKAGQWVSQRKGP
jgi:hypothetical protein